MESIAMIFLYNSLTHQINDNIQQAEHSKAIIESYRSNTVNMLNDIFKNRKFTDATIVNQMLYEKWNNNFLKLLHDEKDKNTI